MDLKAGALHRRKGSDIDRTSTSALSFMDRCISDVEEQIKSKKLSWYSRYSYNVTDTLQICIEYIDIMTTNSVKEKNGSKHRILLWVKDNICTDKYILEAVNEQKQNRHRSDSRLDSF